MNLAQIEYAARRGIQVAENQWRKNAPDVAAQPRDLSLWRHQYVNGHLGEAGAFLWAKQYGVTFDQWTIDEDEPGLPDLCGFINVRAIEEAHHQLYVGLKESVDDAYLLVSAVNFPRYVVLGWCWGHEAKAHGVVRSYRGDGGEAHWVRQGHDIIKAPELLIAEVGRRGLLRAEVSKIEQTRLSEGLNGLTGT